MQAFADFSDSLLGGAVLLALSVALGGVAWGLVVLRAGRGRAPVAVVRRCLTLVVAGAIGLACCQAGVLALKSVVLSGYLGAPAFGRFAQTLQFRAGAVQIGLAVLLAGAAGGLRRDPARAGGWTGVALLAVAVALSGAWLVHAAGRLEYRVPLMGLTVLHEVGAAIWVGGVVQLAGAWRLARRDAAVAAAWPELVARFSRVAIGAVIVLLVAALPLAAAYVGSWGGLVGSGYGSLLVTKAMLMAAALVLGALNFRAGRSARQGTEDGPVRSRVPHLVEAEGILLAILLFAAASLASQPPPVDTAAERATWQEVAEVFRPKWPSLRTPSVETMIEQDVASAAELAGGERTREAYLWSNFSHNVAGLVLLVMSVLALIAWRWRASWVRHWPLGFVALAVFVFLRTSANDGIWPFGPVSLWASLGDGEVLQHRLGAVLAMVVGLLEWRARVRARPGTRLPYVFPVLAAAGGVLLLTHSHAAFEIKRYYLVQVTHTAMGALAVLMACARLLELRLPSPAGRVAGAASTVMMLLIALVLVFYREANIVIAPD